jgi:hypothetical protein
VAIHKSNVICDLTSEVSKTVRLRAQLSSTRLSASQAAEAAHGEASEVQADLIKFLRTYLWVYC